MLWIWIAAMFGIFRFRGAAYWKWVGALLVWMLGATFLFAGGGTLENPSGDGLIAHQIRIMTNDGPGMGLFAIIFVVGYYAGIIFLARKLWITGKAVEEENLSSEWDSGVKTSMARKSVEALFATGFAAAWFYAFFILPAQANGAVPPATQESPAQSAASDATDPIASELVEVATQMSKEGPKKLDPVTTLLNVTAEGRTLIYHYGLSRRDGTDKELILFAKKTAVAKACRNKDMLEGMRDYQITYRYSYLFPNSDAPVSVDANYAECRSMGLS